MSKSVAGPNLGWITLLAILFLESVLVRAQDSFPPGQFGEDQEEDEQSVAGIIERDDSESDDNPPDSASAVCSSSYPSSCEEDHIPKEKYGDSISSSGHEPNSMDQNMEGDIWRDVSHEGNRKDFFYNNNMKWKNMEEKCGTLPDREWTRIAYLDMRDHTHHCPGDWREISHPKRTCGRTNNEGDNDNGGGCSSALFNTSHKIGSYTRVCGRIRGYQFCNTMAFWAYYHNMEAVTIDDPFLDGVTLSNGKERVHIWSFVAALHEGYKGRDAVCPCTNDNVAANRRRVVRVPSWVGEDYFCETGANGRLPPASSKNCSLLYEKAFYDDDPLWDGHGCGQESSCCDLNGPPWFSKTLTRPSSEDIEVRICGSGYTSFGDTPIELVEIYVQ